MATEKPRSSFFRRDDANSTQPTESREATRENNEPRERRNFENSEGGERREWKPREDRGERKPWGDRNREGGERREWKPRTESTERREWKPRTESTERREWKPREEGAERKPWGDRNREGGERREWKPRTESTERREWKPRTESTERREWKPREEGVERKPWGDRNREGGERREWKPREEGAERKPWGDRNREGGERREWKPRTEGADRKPWGDRNREGGERREWKPRTEGADRKPWGDRNREGGERREWKPRTEGAERKPAGERREWTPRTDESNEPKSYLTRERRLQDRASEAPLTAKIETDPKAPLRLNRYIAMSGVCSRREADVLIAEGQVTVNGVVVDQLGAKVTREDKICLNGDLLKGEKKVYIIMNKPKGYVTTTDDPHADKTIIDLLKGEVKERVYPVGRLDKNTTGVLLLTNDGELTNELTHPSYEKRKLYHVFLDKPCTEADLNKLLTGIELEDGEIKADAAEFVDGVMDEVGIEIHSGRNRIVRRMFEHLGYEVVKLDRVFFAGFTKMGLRRGFWRYLSPREVATLKGGSYK